MLWHGIKIIGGINNGDSKPNRQIAKLKLRQVKTLYGITRMHICNYYLHLCTYVRTYRSIHSSEDSSRVQLPDPSTAERALPPATPRVPLPAHR